MICINCCEKEAITRLCLDCAEDFAYTTQCANVGRVSGFNQAIIMIKKAPIDDSVKELLTTTINRHKHNIQNASIPQTLDEELTAIYPNL
jgi:hypothetical protein